MSKEIFHNLLDRYLKGTASEEEERQVEQWYGMLDDEGLQVSGEELLDVSKRIQENLNMKLDEELVIIQPGRKRWQGFAMAASFAGLLVILGYLLPAPVKNASFIKGDIPSITETRNTTQKELAVTLSDGSVATLQPGSSLRYPTKFAKDIREVALVGEAFFEVTKDKAHPFFVYSDNLVTHVLGTSFSVKTDPKTKNQEVSVRTGKVSVMSNMDQSLIKSIIVGKEEVVLLPNQRVVQVSGSSDLSVSLVENPQPLHAERALDAEAFTFDNEKLSSVFTRLSELYGVSFDIEGDAIKHCTFTGDLNDATLATQLQFICRSTGLTYKINGTMIQIGGKGCVNTP